MPTPATALVIGSLAPQQTPTPALTEVEVEDVGARLSIELEVRDASPKIPSGEAVLPPPPMGTILHVAHLSLVDEVAGTPQQQPTSKREGVAGTSAGNFLIIPPKWQYAIPTELNEDPMLMPETLKGF